MKVLLFGTGEYYNRYKIWFADEEVIALIDNSEQKQGTYIDGKKVVSPNRAVLMDYDAIFIMSFYISAMKRQLIELGVLPEKIYHFYDIHDLIFDNSIKKEVKIYGTSLEESGNKGILLINCDLTLGGPALALYNAAKVLIRSGLKVTYASQIDGPLREILEREGIPVIVDSNLMVETMNECEWIQGYSKIVCNTINYHVFLSERDTSIPVVWWLHDSLFFYDSVNQRAIQSISTENMDVWAVGPVAERAIKMFRPDFNVKDQLYGVEDKYIGTREKQNDGVVHFVTIGYVEERKGQDILIEAIKKLSPTIRKRAKFSFVGNNTSMLAERIMREASSIEEVEFLGLVSRDKINQILDKCDMLICPSREDPMPTVCAESMMHEVPCLMSDAIGTIKYISNGVDGIVFSNENVDQLAEKITWVVNNRDELKQIGKKARKVFEREFDMHAFETNLLGKM